MELPVEEYKEKLTAFWENVIRKSDEGEMAEMGRERIAVFVVSLILAICLWFMVNLSMDYNLNIDLPIEAVSMPEDRALADELPRSATVSLSGEGWKLISVYNNPPEVEINVSESEVNLYEQVQQQLNVLSNISVQKVQPIVLTLELEPRVSKKVPVHPAIDVSFDNQFGFKETPSIEPDSITISGAESLIGDIEFWPTDTLRVESMSDNFTREVPLRSSSLISLSRSEVQLNGEIVQFTEGESKVDLDTQNFPSDRSISYSPSTIKVKYRVPIDEYANVQDEELFEAYLTYQQIMEDSTGYIRPNVEKVSDNEYVRIRSFQPEEVAYFMVLDD